MNSVVPIDIIDLLGSLWWGKRKKENGEGEPPRQTPEVLVILLFQSHLTQLFSPFTREGAK